MRNLPVFLVFVLICPAFIYAQQTTIEGKVIDDDTQEPLVNANVLVKGKDKGTVTDVEGSFSLTVEESNKVVLAISYVGYEETEKAITDFTKDHSISLAKTAIPGQEIVVTASKVSENVMESPVSIEKMDAEEIEQASSGDFYQGISNFKGVDLIESSIGFKTVNMRGFNTTTPVRAVQFVDGMDNQAPGLNFPVGNLVGASEIDLQNIEVISGASSALYGANAFQGVISMKTKSPYYHQGLSAKIKGGTRNMMEGQLRYARTLGKEDKFAFKVVGSYMTVDDWEATHPTANRYGDIETSVNLTEILRQRQNDESLSEEEQEDIDGLLNWFQFQAQNAYPGKIDIQAPGYDEKDIVDYNSNSLKLAGEAHYKFTEDVKASYTYKFGQGTAIYQGVNRYSINDIKFQQHKLQVDGKNFQVRGYTTLEEAGQSYDIVFTGINLSRRGARQYVDGYLSEYIDALEEYSNEFDDGVSNEDVDSARIRARSAAANEWVDPGTEEFDSLQNKITNNPDLREGSQFQDNSSLQHIEGQYNVPWDYMDIILGGSVRRYHPSSYGTIFSDSLKNPADTLDNGRNDPDAEYVNLDTYTGGAFVQGSKSLFDDHLKLVGSVRFDKHENFNLQFSPRLSVIYQMENQTFRVSGLSAFRSPTLQDQYIDLNLGPVKLLGNTSGFDNLYTLSSVDEVNSVVDSTSDFTNETLAKLETINLDPVQPEQVQTIEFGYRGMFEKKFYIDVTGYFSVYDNFIGEVRAARPEKGEAGKETGVNDILVDNYEVLQIPTNAEKSVETYGGSIGLNYYFARYLNASANYTYADISVDEDDPIIPGFNTPEHKFNIGLNGNRVWEGLGFSTNFKWVDEYMWRSSFGDGMVDSYYTLDAQVFYELDNYYSTISIGASNLTNNEFRTAYGAPRIGRLIYASIKVDLNKFGSGDSK